MFTLATFAKTAKRYALNASISNETFLNALLEPYVNAGHIKLRGGADFVLGKERTSSIMNERCGVPLDLRKALGRVGLEEETAANFDAFFDEIMDEALFEFFANEIIEHLDNDSSSEAILTKDLAALIETPCAWMAHALIAAIKADNKDINDKALWHCGTGSLHVKKGNIFSNCFGKECKTRKVIVVPVNTTFDTKITWSYENDPKPLVSEKTIHGQWLKRMEDAGVTMAELDAQIEESLQTQNIQPIAERGQGTSPKPEYPLGTVAVVPGKRAMFYLLAISTFNENNNAQSTKEQIGASLEKLIGFYDRRGQGLDLYLPLMGTGMSRASLSHQESYDLIVAAISKSKANIHGHVTIVIYKGDVDKVEL